MATAYEQATKRRAEQQRIIEEGGQRLREVLERRGGDTSETDRDALLGDACYVMGIESDYDPDEGE